MPPEGSVEAEILVVSDSPMATDTAERRPMLGRAGKVFDLAVAKSGLQRHKMRILNLVPTRAPGDDFTRHSPADRAWGLELFRLELARMKNVKVVFAMGEHALHQLTGLNQIGKWRGSVLGAHSSEDTYENYMRLLGLDIPAPLANAHIIPTYAPSDVAKQFPWHPWLFLDFEKGKKLLAGGELRRPKRSWHFNDLVALEEFASRVDAAPESHEGFIAFDTESWPDNIMGIATGDAVYSFIWDEKYRPALTKIMESKFILKVAHNLQHDLTWTAKKLGIKPALPWFDTMGGAHVLHPEMDVNLSPAIATRYTDWPHHKWLVDYDPLWYNGMDCVVAYDAYWPIMDELFKNNLYDVNKHDHALLEPLLDMQWFGFKVDEDQRVVAEQELNDKRSGIVDGLQQMVEPIVAEKIGKFEKPHLFRVMRSCECCGGGSKSRVNCWRCGGLVKKPEKKEDYANRWSGTTAKEKATAFYCSGDNSESCVPLAGTKVSTLRESLPSCRVCGGHGKVEKSLPFNPDSPDQVADVLYRGAGVRARKYKGVESVRVGQLEPLVGEHPLIQPIVEYARVNADFETVRRLHGGPDGRLHCVFDPLRGTGSGRVASYEGLVEVGTNAMNIPKEARRLVVPDPGHVFLYPDMAAVEGRALAVISKDPTLIELFNDGGDLHALVRDDMRKLGFQDFSRDQAKRLDYAVPYGGEAKQIHKELVDEAFRKGEGATKLTVGNTELIIQTLLNGRYKGIAAWQRGVEEQLLRSRQLISITGRRFEWFDYIYDKKTKGVKREIVKQAYSREPQDIGAWVLAEGMMRAWQSGEWERVRGLIHVHDALLFQTKEEDVEEAKALLEKWLTVELWGMKFLTNIKVGNNWKEAS